MNELMIPWLDLVVLTPLWGAVWTMRYREQEKAQRWQLAFASLTMAFSLGAWLTSGSSASLGNQGGASWIGPFISDKALSLDELSAPLVPLAALLFLMLALATMRTKFRVVSFPATLLSEALTLALLCCREEWGVIALLCLGTLPPLAEYHSRGRSMRNYLLHMGVSSLAMIVGWAMWEETGFSVETGAIPLGLLTLGVFIRSGIVPLHCWMTDLFENVTFGTALFFVTPMAGAYAAVRLLLPLASAPYLQTVAQVGLLTAAYAAGMAVVQTEARRFFCYLFLSHSALVLVGLGISTPLSLTGSLCVWFSVGMALAGFGLTLRSLEARTGRISLTEYHGLYFQTPRLAVFFLVTGLACVGFPGTVGFVATEILMDSVVQEYPFVGMSVVLVAAVNGIAVMNAYFKLFTGTMHPATINLRSRWKERTAIMAMTALILLGGLVPQPGIASRYHAAVELLHAARVQPKPHTTAEHARNEPLDHDVPAGIAHRHQGKENGLPNP